jgi:hypothetical protein
MKKKRHKKGHISEIQSAGQFDELFYQQLFCHFKNEVELSHFYPTIMPDTNIKIEVMNVCQESWKLFFEEKFERFIKGYEMKKTSPDYKKYYEEEGCQCV